MDLAKWYQKKEGGQRNAESMDGGILAEAASRKPQVASRKPIYNGST